MNTSLALPDFDTLVALHQKNPVAYEILRRDLLQGCVLDAPDQYQPMLDDLIWRMDMVRAAATSPLEAAAAAGFLMMESVAQMRAQLFALQNAKAKWYAQILLANLRH